VAAVVVAVRLGVVPVGNAVAVTVAVPALGVVALVVPVGNAVAVTVAVWAAVVVLVVLVGNAVAVTVAIRAAAAMIKRFIGCLPCGMEREGPGWRLLKLESRPRHARRRGLNRP
jgi:hypothetical protein